MRTSPLLVVLLAATPLWAQGTEPDFSGQLRTLWSKRQANSAGPLAQANEVVPGTVATTRDTLGQQAELRFGQRLNALQLDAVGTVEVQYSSGRGTRTQGWLNEGVVSGNTGPWQWSVGKKVVAWDVGYGFRPNDVVQQEVRRSLASATPEGRPVLMAEHFNAHTAWSLVWVNPTQHKSNTGSSEPAVAARVYQRTGAVDWHGFARRGSQTGTSAGAAVSWVASDDVELHASWRGYARAAIRSTTAAGSALARTNPWQTTPSGPGQQALIGGTWTSESQLSLLVEAWWDGTAPATTQWSTWLARNQALPLTLSQGAPATAVAGNLAWQGEIFGAGQGLQRSNLYARLSWQHEAWQTALDVLYHPADRGRMITATAAWQGDRFRLEGGLRVNTGPAQAVVRQLPIRQEGYVRSVWTF